MSITITDTQKVHATISAKDARGNPAVLDGVPTWASSDETIATVEAAADGMSADVFAVGALGTAQVVIIADVLVGDEVELQTGLLDVIVIGGKAVTIEVVPGVPEEQ